MAALLPHPVKAGLGVILSRGQPRSTHGDQSSLRGASAGTRDGWCPNKLREVTRTRSLRVPGVVELPPCSMGRGAPHCDGSAHRGEVVGEAGEDTGLMYETAGGAVWQLLALAAACMLSGWLGWGGGAGGFKRVSKPRHRQSCRPSPELRRRLRATRLCGVPAIHMSSLCSAASSDSVGEPDARAGRVAACWTLS